MLAVVTAAAFAVRSSPAPQSAPSPRETPRDRISCLGHIEPEDGVIVLSARSLMGQPSIVAELKVKEGDRVERGQIVAVLNSHDQLEAAWQEAEARVVLAQRQLAQVEAGARSGDIAAQQAEVARLEAELANAERDYRRAATLAETKSIPIAELDASQTRVASLRQALQQAKGRLASIGEVRKTDLDAARAAVAAAEAAARRARAEFEPSIVRSPVAARVIKIRAQPGAEIGAGGLIELGKTDRMYAIAEVPEEQIAAVRRGAPAKVSGESVGTPFDGTVEDIGYQVGQSQMVARDPTAFVESRVVQVKVRLSDAARAERLIHARVTVVIGS